MAVRGTHGWRAARLAGSALAAALAGCSLLLDTGGATGGGPRDGGDGANDSGAATDGGDGVDAGVSEGGSSECPGTGGPAMRLVGPVGLEFCIDSTEVTREQYGAFLATAPQAPPSHPRCGFKTTHSPTARWPYTAGNAQEPITDIDWCDAFAFCAWAGKRLCGKIGGGALTTPTERADEAQSELLNACTGGGDRSYAYGDEYVPGRCHGPDAGAPAPVGSLATCEGGYPGLFDMSGNVAEMTDSCGSDAPDASADRCIASAGSFIDPNGGTIQKCDSEAITARGVAYKNAGVRCCADRRE